MLRNREALTKKRVLKAECRANSGSAICYVAYFAKDARFIKKSQFQSVVWTDDVVASVVASMEYFLLYMDEMVLNALLQKEHIRIPPDLG